MALKDKKIKNTEERTIQMVSGSTLIEVLIAQVLIMIVFLGTTLIYIQIANSNYGRKYFIQQELTELASKLKKGGEFGNRTHDGKYGIVINEFSEPYQHSTTLIYLRLEAIKNLKTITVYEEVIPITSQ